MIKIFILGECWLGLCGRSSMIKVIRDLKAMNVLAKFENDPRKITNVRALTELVCHAPHLGNNTPEHYRGWGVKKWPTFEVALIFRIWWIDLSVRWACIWWVYPPSRFLTRGRLAPWPMLNATSCGRKCPPTVDRFKYCRSTALYWGRPVRE